MDYTGTKRLARSDLHDESTDNTFVSRALICSASYPVVDSAASSKAGYMCRSTRRSDRLSPRKTQKASHQPLMTNKAGNADGGYPGQIFPRCPQQNRNCRHIARVPTKGARWG